MVKSVFGDNLERLRKLKGLTRKQLANELEINETTLAGYENLGREPKYSVLVRIADYFNVSVDNLIRESNANELQFSMRNNVLTVAVPDEFKDTIIYTLPVAAKILQELNRRALKVAKTNEPETLSWELRPHNENNEVINDSAP